MIDRRTFIASSLAVPAASWAAPLVTPFGHAVAAEADLLALDRFVFDARFAEASDVAAQIEGLGVSLAPFAGDLTELWYEELDLHWKQAPMALAGVTTQEGLFVLETLALDRGMRVVFRGEHGVAREGKVTHTLSGPAALLAQISPLPAGTAWPSALAAAFTQCPLGRSEVAEVELVTEMPGLSLRDVPLHSWIIAPRAAVASVAASRITASAEQSA